MNMQVVRNFITDLQATIMTTARFPTVRSVFDLLFCDLEISLITRIGFLIMVSSNDHRIWTRMCWDFSKLQHLHPVPMKIETNCDYRSFRPLIDQSVDGQCNLLVIPTI